MPAPDVQYVLDGSLECGHVAGDTHHYMMEMAPDADRIVDGYHRGEEDGRSHWRHLTDMGLHFEEHYLKFRMSNRKECVNASVSALRHASTMFNEMSSTYGGVLAGQGLHKFTPGFIRQMDDRFDMTRANGILRRSLARASADLQAWTATDFETHRQATHRPARIFAHYVPKDPQEESRIQRMRVRLRKEAEKDRRKVVKRSARLLSKLIGSDSTRMFIGGNALRVEGRHAIYEISKTSPLHHSHGGFEALSVYDRDDPRILLCKICIVTTDVPLLDHVASLVLHIRAGMEDEILRVGNPREISPDAYQREWLVPFLPVQTEAVDYPRSCLFTPMPPNWKVDRERMKPVAARYLFREVFAPHASLIRSAVPYFGRTGMLRATLDQRIELARADRMIADMDRGVPNFDDDDDEMPVGMAA